MRSTAADNLFLPLVPGPGTHSVPATALSVCLVSQDGRKRNTVRTLCMSGPDACVEEGELNRQGEVRGRPGHGPTGEKKRRTVSGKAAGWTRGRRGSRCGRGPGAAVMSCVALSLTRRPHPEQRMWELSSPTARSAGLFGSVMGGGQMMRNTSTSVYGVFLYELAAWRGGTWQLAGSSPGQAERARGGANGRGEGEIFYFSPFKKLRFRSRFGVVPVTASS